MKRYKPGEIIPIDDEGFKHTSSGKTSADITSEKIRGLYGPWKIELKNGELVFTCLTCGLPIAVDKKGMGKPLGDLTPRLAHTCKVLP